MRPAPITATRTGSPLVTGGAYRAVDVLFHYLDSTSASWYVRLAMRLGVVLEAFVDRTLADTLELLATAAPEVSALEVGVGGFAPAAHCDVERLLRDDPARQDWV